MSNETNIFPITNLSSLSSRYVLYTIRGLNNAPDEYYQNCQNIIKRLSYSMRSPVTIIHRDNVPFLVIEEGRTPPTSLAVIRTNVRFDRSSDTVELDYTVRSAENDVICQRFLDFAVQGALFKNSELWQPAAGYPFFEKQGEDLPDDLVRYLGYSIRSTFTSDGQLGFCVDVTSKTLGKNPLPHHLTHDDFAKWKNRNFVYHYGHQWYEIQLIALSDFNASEYIIPDTELNILEWVVKDCRKPIPAELAAVPHDAAVGMYLNNRNENRGALVSLCYPVYRTSDKEAGKQHSYTILPAYVRRRKIMNFVQRYLRNIPFGANKIQVASNAAIVEPRMFAVPDILFGNNKVLSVRSTAGAQHVSLDKLGEARMALLRDKGAGFYGQKPLGRHYLILPQSVADSFGQSFTEDLIAMVAELFPHPYDPTLVTYNDRVPKTFAKQGNAILEAVRNKCELPGYAVVMIHHTTDRKTAAEDQLAAMVMRELRDPKIDIKAAVIHSAVGQECYELVQQKGKPSYQINQNKRGKLLGYLRMVAINKVLLNNERWPFVLSTRLHADLTIGLDVKQNTAGLVVVGKNGGEINTLFKTSRQKEKLTRDQTKAYLVEIIREEAKARMEPITTIVLQRDGRLFDTERNGAHDAIEFLKREGTIAPDATITLVEIPKTSPVRLRLFDVNDQNGRPWVENPQIGTYCIINDTDGYLCATGRAFPKSGTVRPLHVRRLEGSLTLEQCLEDVFYLTCLAWTRPDDATRYPITVKLNDRFLGEEASEYDIDALDIDAILDEQAEMEASYE
jgi:hypothetical protein